MHQESVLTHELCSDVTWEVSGASGTEFFGSRLHPALALAQPAPGPPLALIGFRPQDTGDPAVGSLIAIDVASGQVQWRESAQKEMRFLTGCVNDRAHEAAHGAQFDAKS